MDRLTTEQVIRFLELLADRMPEHAEMLRELDAQLGDGDLGITMTLGMAGIKQGLSELPHDDVGMVIARSGLNFNRAAASTFGAILATGFMRAGQQVKGRDEVTLQDLGAMFEAAAEGIMERGGARPGEKTVLDVIVPMAETLRQAAADASSLVQAVQRAHDRCQQALQETVTMEGKHGRAGWLKEKSVGVQDPGSTALCLMVDCLREFVENLPE